MIIILFAIVLIFFLNIQTVDFGVLGKLRYFNWDTANEPFIIEDGLYGFIIVMLVVLGVLALLEIIKLANQSKISDSNKSLRLEELKELYIKNLINEKEYVERRTKILDE